jgi:hypothetical protein
MNEGFARPVAIRSQQEGRLGETRLRPVHLEVSVRPGAASVDDPLRNSLVVEVSDLLPEQEVLYERRSARSNP